MSRWSRRGSSMTGRSTSTARRRWSRRKRRRSISRPTGCSDIQVDTGTTDSQRRRMSTGTITGPASSGRRRLSPRLSGRGAQEHRADDAHRAAAADLGFDIAGAADVVGNAVVLSAGHDIEFGNTSFAPSAASGAAANISLTTVISRPRSTGAPAAMRLVGAAVGGSSTFASDVSLRARDEVLFHAGNAGSTVTVGGNLTLSANAEGVDAGRFGDRRVGRTAGL